MPVPAYDDLLNPALQAVHELGGSCAIREMADAVTRILGLTEDEVNEIHGGNQTKLEYRLAWARNYLKNYGILENSTRGVWSLTPKGKATPRVDKAEVRRYVVAMHRRARSEHGEDEEVEEESELTWQDELIQVVQSIPPDAFERLCQRLLRESGFIHVEVTGKTGDGGIDGKGVVKLGNLLSFHVIFQCKRYSGSVTASTVRDFRGAMVGRADKGLLITTGRFTRDARAEAQRDGAPPLDLIDGEELAEMLKILGLGVGTEMVERVTVQKDWFLSL